MVARSSPRNGGASGEGGRSFVVPKRARNSLDKLRGPRTNAGLVVANKSSRNASSYRIIK